MVGDAALREVVGPDALAAIAAADLALAIGGAGVVAALARFLCWERESWHSTTIPVGRCVIRIAESVLLTCWPPAPDAR